MERVREGCVMPTDKRRWQPCSFGTQSQANRVAIAGCHASGGWTRDRTYHTQASRLKLAKVRLEDIEGDLSQGVRQLYRAGKDAFAERVMALMLPQNCVEADKCCYACFRTHFLAAGDGAGGRGRGCSVTATDRDSTAGRRLWNRKHCAGLQCPDSMAAPAT